MTEKIKEFIPYVIILIVVLLIRSFIVTPVMVHGTSMDSTLKEGNVLLLNKWTYYFNDIKRNDIVVIDNGREPLIKRVIGLPGEHVKYVNHKLYINNNLIDDSFSDKTNDFDLSALKYDIIPDNMYFVLGDNRQDSLDSRIIGLIKEEDIEGKVNIRLWPLNQISKINQE